jgi:hypothetical protein
VETRLEIEVLVGLQGHPLKGEIRPAFHGIVPALTLETQVEITVSQDRILVFLETSSILMNVVCSQPLSFQGG